jgi:hypothetical protein
METFPGARIEAVHDSRADAYGLPPVEPDMPEFAPVEAGFADSDTYLEDEE